jgi:LDH2 family malate/lactate/ureidoglycolate dehydrogenase
VVIPGQPEAAMEAERLKNGIALQESVVQELKALADKFNLVL